MVNDEIGGLEIFCFKIKLCFDYFSVDSVQRHVLFVKMSHVFELF